MELTRESWLAWLDEAWRGLERFANSMLLEAQETFDAWRPRVAIAGARIEVLLRECSQAVGERAALLGASPAQTDQVSELTFGLLVLASCVVAARSAQALWNLPVQLISSLRRAREQRAIDRLLEGASFETSAPLEPPVVQLGLPHPLISGAKVSRLERMGIHVLDGGASFEGRLNVPLSTSRFRVSWSNHARRYSLTVLEPGRLAQGRDDCCWYDIGTTEPGSKSLHWFNSESPEAATDIEVLLAQFASFVASKHRENDLVMPREPFARWRAAS